jgi:hypothetical protein
MPKDARIMMSLMLVLSTLAHAQIAIERDTLSFDCRQTYDQRNRVNQFVISTDEQFRESGFANGRDDGCLPFIDIDFNKSILVGFKYRGSNCDRRIESSAIIQRGEKYLIQFAISPRHVCRDLNFRIAWFILTKPANTIELAFERLSQ